jgi:serine/threonine protein kinase
MMGLNENKNTLYIIDFGLAKKYKKQISDSSSLGYKVQKKLTGTARYASINAHKGVELFRKDDLESIGYVLVYLMKGKLPWQGVKAEKRDDKIRKIFEKKKNTGIDELIEDLHSKYFN